MKISVIIPTYKPKDYLWRCLSSLANQTMDKNMFEVIIVLNGDKEPYQTQIQDFIASMMKNMQVRFIQTDSAGASLARNMGLDIATGEYIAFIDDDDYVSPTYLEKLSAKANPSTVVISNTRICNDTGEFLPSVFTKAYQDYSSKEDINYWKIRRFFSGQGMKLIPRNIIGDRRFNVQFRNGQDCLFMFLISNRFEQVCFADADATYYYVYRPNSLSRITHKQRIHNGWRMMCEYTRIFIHGKAYHPYFYFTRILACIHYMITKENVI